MARVYLAHDARHDRQVAIKVLRDELAASIGAERFLAEIKTTAKLNHPHILPLHDSGEADGYLYYVMPLVEGETLRDRLTREHQMSVDDAIAIARRSPTPSRTRTPTAWSIATSSRRTSFSPADTRSSATSASRRPCRTARRESPASAWRSARRPYMSPEQAAGEDVDGRADQYALASVLYEMLAGEPPFTGPTFESILVQRFTQAPPEGRARKRAGVPTEHRSRHRHRDGARAGGPVCDHVEVRRGP